ncbi:MAG: sugar kinase, partial [Candidatus Neomarinimicrobiota bacterium]
MSGKPILIVGSIGLDTIETISDRRESILGGSATYATVSAGKSADVHLVGIIGTDFPRKGIKIFEKYSQDLSNLDQKEGQTFSWGGRYPDDWDDRETLFTELGVFADYEPKLTKNNKKTPILFLANIHPELQYSVLQQNSKRECVIIDTMNLWIGTERKKLKEVVSYCDVLLLNEFEAEQFTRR